MVIAAERAETIATTIQRICLHEGQPCDVKRAASNAPVSAKGSAKTECSNLIISSTVRMRLAVIRREPDLPQRHREHREELNLSQPYRSAMFGFHDDSCLQPRCFWCLRDNPFSRFGFPGGRVAGPAIHFFLGQTDLREDATDVLGDEVVDGFRLMVEGRNRR